MANTVLGPAVHLARLDIPAKGGLWRAWQFLRSNEGRRKRFMTLLTDESLDEADRLGKLRTLVDLGLWGPRGPSDQKALGFDRQYLGYCLLQARDAGLCSKEVLHLALEAGMDPNWHEQNHRDDTLLTLFARNDQQECLRLALEAGADPRICDSCDCTPLHLLLEMASRTDKDNKEILKSAKILIDRGVDPNDPGRPRYGDANSPPIKVVIEAWNEQVLAWFIKQGARLDVKDKEGQTPMHWVACNTPQWKDPPEEPMLALLAQHQVAMDEPNCRGETPLWQALKWRNISVARWLIKQGASVNCQPHTFRDSQGYPFPRPGESLLQVFCQNLPVTPENVSLMHDLLQGNNVLWRASTPDGGILIDWIREHRSPWLAFAQAAELEEDLAQAPPAQRRRPSPRL